MTKASLSRLAARAFQSGGILTDPPSWSCSSRRTQ
jgi:hypothetical protein